MIVSGLTMAQFREVLADLQAGDPNARNICVDESARNQRLNAKGDRFRLKLRTRDSRGLRSKVKRSMGRERHIPALCWHGFRDVLQAVFERYPNARIDTAMAKYIGLEGFMEKYPATGLRNVGSQMFPVQAREECDCVADGVE